MFINLPDFDRGFIAVVKNTLRYAKVFFYNHLYQSSVFRYLFLKSGIFDLTQLQLYHDGSARVSKKGENRMVFPFVLVEKDVLFQVLVHRTSEEIISSS